MAPPAEFNEKGVVWALVCAIGDVCADVRVSAQSSLIKLGSRQPTPVLRALLHTCTQQPPPSPGVMATLIDISQKVITDSCKVVHKSDSEEMSDNVFEEPDSLALRASKTLEWQMLQDWLDEAVHQLTRTGASNTVRVAADNLLVTIAAQHNCFNKVVDALLSVLSNHSSQEVSWQSAAETLGNVCSSRPQHSVGIVSELLVAMLEGAKNANSDQVRAVVAATVAKLAHTVAEAVAERDNKTNNHSVVTLNKEENSADDEKEESDAHAEKQEDQELHEQEISEAGSDEPVTADLTDPLLKDNFSRPPLEDNLLGELNLEEELHLVESQDQKGLELPFLAAHLIESPPSSRLEIKNETTDTTPEDGVTLDLNFDDLPSDQAEATTADTVRLNSYTTQCDQLADILVNHWLKSSNVDLRNESVAAIGHITALLSREKLELITPIVMSTVVSLYRKVSLPYNLTCTLAQLLAAVVKQEAQDCFKHQLESVTGAVLNQASVFPCYSEPSSMSNHSEALRCCHLLSLCYPAQVAAQLLCRLENASHVQRVAALVVMKHLIGCKVVSDDIISATVRLLQPILHDSNTRVIRSVAQLILELCHRGHLDELTAPLLVAYLVKHSAGAGGSLLCNGPTFNNGCAGNVSLGLLTEETVGDTCSRALYLLATAVPCSHPLLWPRLFSFLVNSDYESSLSTVLSCLAHLVVQPQHSPQALPLLPLLQGMRPQVTPQLLVTRLLGLCSDPGIHPALGGYALALLQGLGGHISDKLQRHEWREQVEQLRRTCISLSVTEQDVTSTQIWQDTVREFLSLTLIAIDDPSFTDCLVTTMLCEASADSDTERRVFLVSALGVALRHCADASLVTDTLGHVLRLTNHRSAFEQAGLGICVGSCGAGHTELVLGQIALWLKEADTKKMISFMSMLKSESGEGSACLRLSVVVCLGQLCALAPPEQLRRHVDGPIMLHLINLINTNKLPAVGSAVVDCISNLCRALGSVTGAELSQRPLLIAHLVRCCEAASPSELPPVLSALKDLVLLEPVLEVEERTILLQAVLNASLDLLVSPGKHSTADDSSDTASTCSATHSVRPSLTHRLSLSHTANTLRSLAAASTPRHSITSFSGSVASAQNVARPSEDKADTGNKSCSAPVEADALTGDAGRAYAQLNLLLRTVIQRDPTPAPLDDITTLLQSWLLHSNITVRSAAITLLLHTLHTFHTHLLFPPQVPVNFHQTSQLVGAVLPRLGDSCGSVRCGGVGCVVAVLRVAARYNAHPPQQVEEALQPLTDVQKEIGSRSGEQHELLLRKVAQVLCRELSGVQLRGLVFAAASGLQDKQAGGRHAVAVVLSEALKQRGHTLHYCCKQLLDHVYSRLERVSDSQTRLIVVDGLTYLASPHLPLLADTLLSYPIPPHRGVCETWQSIGCNPSLVCAALTHMQQVVERTHAYTLQRTHTQHTVKVATIQPLAVLLCLTQLLQKLQNVSDSKQVGTESGAVDECSLSSIGEATTPCSLATTATLGVQEESGGSQGSGHSTPTPLNPHPHAEAREAVLGAVPGLLAALLPRFGSYVGVLPPLQQSSAALTESNGTALHHKTMSSFVPNPGATNIVPARALIECLANVWGVMGYGALRHCLLQEARDISHTHTVDTLTHTLTNMATLVVSSAPGQLSALVTALSGPHAERGERAAIAAFYSQLVHDKCGGNFEVLSRVTSVLLMLVQDVCPDVRRLALRGLAHYAHLHHQQVCDRLHEIVGALVGGTDQREEALASIDAEEEYLTPTSNSVPAPHISSGSRILTSGIGPPLGPGERVCMEALRGLAALLPLLPAETVLPHTTLLLIRCRLFAEKSNGEMREASFGVVRGLCTVVGDSLEFQDHLSQHLLAAILHLADAHQPTVVLCKSALLSLSQHVSHDGMKELLQTRLNPSTSLDYKHFLAALAPLLVTWLGDQLSLIVAASCSYFHSRQPELRAAAAHFTSEMVRWGGGEGASGVATGLVLLMKDPEPSVRTAAATAAHLLSHHTHVL